jgi:predicted PurR-regulated permease PerM
MVSDIKKKLLINQVNKNMNIAGWINVAIGILTLSLCLLSSLRAFILQACISMILGFFYLYRTKKLKTKSWEHMDILIILLITNLFFGAFIPAIFIGLAIKARHQLNVETGKSYFT